MKCMKKYYKILIGCFFIILFLTISLFLIFNKKKMNYSFISVNYDYFIETNELEDCKVSIPLFVDNKNSPYLEKDNIKNLYLTEELSNDKIQIRLNNIEKRSNLKYENKEYYEYCLNCLIPLSSCELISLENVNLNLEYSNEENLSFMVGNFYLYPKLDNNLYYSSLRGLVRNIDKKDYLQGVLIKFNDSFTIKDIKPLSNKVLVDENFTKVYDEVEEIEELRTEKIEKKVLTNCDLKVNANYLFISLFNEQNTPEMGFILKYIKDGKEYETLIYPFRFYYNDDIYDLKKVNYEVDLS